MRRTLKDMIVVITGASAGIGKALAEELHQHGAKLVLSARRMDRLEELNRNLGGGHLCVQADVAKIDDCRSLIEQSIQKFGRIDTLVCNAGYGFYKTIENSLPDDVRNIFATNVMGTTDCIHFAMPEIEKQELRDGFRGHVMIVSSCVGRRGIPYIGIYSATKAAQLMLAEAMRVELKSKNIAVTTVHPIQTKTDFGKVAETMGEIRLPDKPVGQSVETVAKKMVRAIAKPRPEVWPSAVSRYVFGLGTLMPRVVDWAAGVYLRQVEALNVKEGKR